MLYYALVFMAIALMTGVLGLGGFAYSSAALGQGLFFAFVAFLVMSLVVGLFRRAK